MYCREDALAQAGERLYQFLTGLASIPVAVDPSTLVVSDNADIYGTVTDLYERNLNDIQIRLREVGS